MKKDIFKDIIDAYLKESVNEMALTNPNSKEGAYVFNVNATPKFAVMRITIPPSTAETPNCGSVIENGLKQICQKNGVTFRKTSNYGIVQIPVNDLYTGQDGAFDIDSVGGKVVQEVADLYNNTKTGYGTVDINDLIRDFEVANPIRNKSMSREESQNEMVKKWIDTINDLDSEGALKFLRKLNIPIDKSAFTHVRSSHNLALIDVQDDYYKSIDPSWPGVTYLAAPNVWENTFNRRVKTTNHPFKLITGLNNDNYSDETARQAVTDKLGDVAGKFIDHSARANTKTQIRNMEVNPMTRDVGHALNVASKQIEGGDNVIKTLPFYDVSDTELIEGKPDVFYDKERVGVIDEFTPELTQKAQDILNINNTQAAPQATNGATPLSERKEDPAKLKLVYRALVLNPEFGKIIKDRITKDNKQKATVEDVKNFIFNNLQVLAKSYFGVTRDNEVVDEMAVKVACMVCIVLRVCNRQVSDSLQRIKVESDAEGNYAPEIKKMAVPLINTYGKIINGLQTTALSIVKNMTKKPQADAPSQQSISESVMGRQNDTSVYDELVSLIQQSPVKVMDLDAMLYGDSNEGEWFDSSNDDVIRENFSRMLYSSVFDDCGNKGDLNESHERAMDCTTEKFFNILDRINRL